MTAPPNGPTKIDFGEIGTQSSSPVTPQTPAEQRAQASRVQNAKDIFHLGDLYGKEVYLGDAPSVAGVQTPGAGAAGAELGMGEASPETPAFGQTQDFMQQVSQVWASNPAEYQALQAQLAQSGYYGKTGAYVPGRFDAATQTALRAMLNDYESGVVSSQTPMTIDEFLQQNAAATSQAQSAAASVPPVTHVTLTDPETIRASAISAFEAATGKRPSDKQLKTFIETFHSAEQQYQQQGQTASAEGQNSTGTQPDLSSDAMQFAQSQDPRAYASNKATSYVNTLLNMFLPSESQRADVTTAPSA